MTSSQTVMYTHQSYYFKRTGVNVVQHTLGMAQSSWTSTSINELMIPHAYANFSF